MDIDLDGISAECSKLHCPDCDEPNCGCRCHWAIDTISEERLEEEYGRESD